MSEDDSLHQLMWDMEWDEASRIAPSFIRAASTEQRWDREGLPLLEECIFPRLNTLRCMSCTDDRKLASEQFLCSLILFLAERAAQLEVALLSTEPRWFVIPSDGPS